MYNYGADIALGKQNQAKPTIFTGLIEREMSLRNAQNKQNKERLINVDADLKDETKDRLPYFSERAFDVHKDLMNEFNGYKAKGYSDVQAENLTRQNLYKYKNQINDINSSNAAALKLYGANTGTHLTGDKEKAQAIFENRNAIPKDLATLNNPDYGIMATPDGNFSYAPKEYTPVGSVVKKYDSGNFDLENPKYGKISTKGDKQFQEVAYPFTADPKAIQTATDEILVGNGGGNLAHFKYEVYPKLPTEYKSLQAYKDFNSDDTKTRLNAQRELVNKVVADSMTKPDKVVSRPYQPKSSGYNKGTGAAAGDRFASEKNVEGGGVLSPITSTEKLPQVHIESSYALKGDAKEDDAKNAVSKDGKLQPFAEDVNIQGWKPLTDPKTGKKQMFFVVNQPPTITGSDVKQSPDDINKKQITKSTSEDKTWLIPATVDQQSKFFTYTANKNGTNPHKESFLDDLNRMKEFNNKVGGGKKEIKEKPKSDPLGIF